MNKEERFKLIKTKRDEQKFHEEKIEQKTSEIYDLCLEILAYEENIKINSEITSINFYGKSKDYKITKIVPRIYIGDTYQIFYELSGNPKKKDGTFSKREECIKNMSIYISKDKR